MIRALPDIDRLVLDALRAANLGATVAVMWPPGDFADSLPLIVARQVPGGRANVGGIAVANVDVQCAAASRLEASALARDARVALARACDARFRGVDGYLSTFEDITAGPVEIRTGTPNPDPTLFRFQATYGVTVRPA